MCCLKCCSTVQVGWDESTAGERQPRVSLWEIEPLTTFPMYPSSFPLRLKRPWPSGLPSFHSMTDLPTWDKRHMVSFWLVFVPFSLNILSMFASRSKRWWYKHQFPSDVAARWAWRSGNSIFELPGVWGYALDAAKVWFFYIRSPTRCIPSNGSCCTSGNEDSGSFQMFFSISSAAPAISKRFQWA